MQTDFAPTQFTSRPAPRTWPGSPSKPRIAEPASTPRFDKVITSARAAGFADGERAGTRYGYYWGLLTGLIFGGVGAGIGIVLWVTWRYGVSL
jgi:hypothetical protein